MPTYEDGKQEERVRALEVIRAEVTRHKLEGNSLTVDVMALLTRVMDRIEFGK